MQEAYRESELNSELYGRWRTVFEDFFESEKYFFSRGGLITRGMTILDVGCACGGLGIALQHEYFPDIQYTGIDPDPNAIKFGKNKFPHLELITGYFPQDISAEKRYDLVTMFALFPQIPDWKSMLLNLVEFSNRFINVSIILRMSGPTIVDKDVSYVYYLDTQEQVYQVVHNIYEFVNFCCIKEMRAKKISFYGYHKSTPTSSFRPLPQKEQITGNVLIELFPADEGMKRFGGISDQNAMASLGRNVEVFKPEIEIVIDKERVEL